jgi:hypothetical protein
MPFPNEKFGGVLKIIMCLPSSPLVADHRVHRREGRNEVAVVALQIREVAKVAVEEDDDVAIL